MPHSSYCPLAPASQTFQICQYLMNSVSIPLPPPFLVSSHLPKQFSIRSINVLFYFTKSSRHFYFCYVVWSFRMKTKILNMGLEALLGVAVASLTKPLFSVLQLSWPCQFLESAGFPLHVLWEPTCCPVFLECISLPPTPQLTPIFVFYISAWFSFLQGILSLPDLLTRSDLPISLRTSPSVALTKLGITHIWDHH